MFVTSAGNSTDCAIRNTTVIILAARASSSSSEEILSDGNDSNDCNLYHIDVGEMSETSQDVGPCPYRFKPRRVRENVQPEPNREESESETNRLGNTDW